MSDEICSEGARMLIERMQTHPKDFTHDGRFARITDQILGRLPVGFSDLSDRDDTALTEAYGKYILEPKLTEYVVDEIFNGDKRRAEEQAQVSARYSQSLAASMRNTQTQIATGVLAGGFNDPRMTLQGGVYNPAQGQVLWSRELETKPNAVYLNNNGKESTLWQRIKQQLKQLKKSATA
jgi:hypothetical protein